MIITFQFRVMLNKNQYQLIALALAWFTIIYNIIEGVVSIYFGVKDSELALFGFGLDSFIETISASGTLYMLYNQRKTNDDGKITSFETRALKITAYSFFALTAILILLSVNNLVSNTQPETTFWGLVISLASIASMGALIWSKIYVGGKLNSDAIIADARCNLVCVYMSLVLFASALIFYLFEIAHADSLGAMLLAYFSYKEGKEALYKSKNQKKCSCSSCH